KISRRHAARFDPGRNQCGRCASAHESARERIAQPDDAQSSVGNAADRLGAAKLPAGRLAPDAHLGASQAIHGETESAAGVLGYATDPNRSLSPIVSALL